VGVAKAKQSATLHCIHCCRTQICRRQTLLLPARLQKMLKMQQLEESAPAAAIVLQTEGLHSCKAVTPKDSQYTCPHLCALPGQQWLPLLGRTHRPATHGCRRRQHAQNVQQLPQSTTRHSQQYHNVDSTTGLQWLVAPACSNATLD
jgi:hypothetical protein